MTQYRPSYHVLHFQLQLSFMYYEQISLSTDIVQLIIETTLNIVTCLVIELETKIRQRNLHRYL